MVEFAEGWNRQNKILVILAHPDDPEFFCGATIARWCQMGHQVTYVLLTRGDKGTRDCEVDPRELAERREVEQKAAANLLGVHKVRFLDYSDGYLVPDLTTRKEIVRIIRQERPDIIVTSDPTNIFLDGRSINHPDHRAAGQVVLDAVYPAPFDPHYFPDLLSEGLEPVDIKEVWFTVTEQPSIILDVSQWWDFKINALLKHESQIGDPLEFKGKSRKWHTPDSSLENPRYEEAFRRIVF